MSQQKREVRGSESKPRLTKLPVGEMELALGFASLEGSGRSWPRPIVGTRSGHCEREMKELT